MTSFFEKIFRMLPLKLRFLIKFFSKARPRIPNADEFKREFQQNKNFGEK
jgi:hypothetical protein